jgi:hypothetical protein
MIELREGLREEVQPGIQISIRLAPAAAALDQENSGSCQARQRTG